MSYTQDEVNVAIDNLISVGLIVELGEKKNGESVYAAKEHCRVVNGKWVYVGEEKSKGANAHRGTTPPSGVMNGEIKC